MVSAARFVGRSPWRRPRGGAAWRGAAESGRGCPAGAFTRLPRPGRRGRFVDGQIRRVGGAASGGCHGVDPPVGPEGIPQARPVLIQWPSLEKRMTPMQNTFHAVMAQRREPADSQDDFPTPPWATRALIECVMALRPFRTPSAWSLPAAGAICRSRFGSSSDRVEAFDAFPYGFASIRDFLTFPYEVASHEWIITNPPFRLAEDFVDRAFSVARRGIAILLPKNVFLESVGRYDRISGQAAHLPRSSASACQWLEAAWTPRPLPRLATRGRMGLEMQGSGTKVIWIPPCRRKLERHGDYHQASCLSKAAQSFLKKLFRALNVAFI